MSGTPAPGTYPDAPASCLANLRRRGAGTRILREDITNALSPRHRRLPQRPYALFDHLLEFKTVSLKAAGLTGAELAEKPQEAEQRLAAYRDLLERRERTALTLQTHAVVRIGLERLVW